MTMQTKQALAAPLRLRHRTGISFIEVLFSIMILGIGFIMVAAIFPVAASQNLATYDQTMASQMAEASARHLESMATMVTMPQTMTPDVLGSSSAFSFWRSPAMIWSFYDERYANAVKTALANYPAPERETAWAAVKGNMISSNDPRYAWTAVYSRDYGDPEVKGIIPYGQVFVFALRNRIRAAYTTEDVDGVPGNANSRLFPELRPKEVSVLLREGTGADGVPAPDIIYFAPAIADRGSEFGVRRIPTHEAVAEGCFVVISDDFQPFADSSASSKKLRGLANGRVYRVGIRRPDLDGHSAFPAYRTPIEGVVPQAWELIPGWDMPSGIGCWSPGPDLKLHTADDNQNIPIQLMMGIAIPARAFIIGRGYKDPANPAAGFDGPAQDIAIFTSYIAINQKLQR